MAAYSLHSATLLPERDVKITLLSEDRNRLESTAGALTIEAESAAMQYSPFHMVGSGLAVCTFAVLQSWAQHSNIPADGLAIEVGWEFAEKPKRVSRYDLQLIWPELPENRRAAAQRAAALCPIHTTLHHLPEVVTEVKG